MVSSTCPALWLLQRPWSHRAEHSPRHHCLVSRTVRHPYPPVLVRNGAALGEGPHTPKPAASQSTKVTCLTLPCCRRHSQGPFFSYHRDVEMTSPGRSIALEKPPGRMRAAVTPLLPLPGQGLSLTRHVSAQSGAKVRDQGHLRHHTSVGKSRWGVSWFKQLKRPTPGGSCKP